MDGNSASRYPKPRASRYDTSTNFIKQDHQLIVDTRAKKIDSYGNGYTELVEALKKYPKEMWQWRDPHGCWSIHELIVHITDSEANSYIRCRRFIAEPGEPLMAYDENQWAASLDYHNQNSDDAIEMFRWLRLRSYSLIKTLPEEVWSNSNFHPENGDMTLDDWLDTYESHVTEHVGHMQENFDAWTAEQK